MSLPRPAKVPRYSKSIAKLHKAKKATRTHRKSKGIKKRKSGSGKHRKSSRRGTRLTFFLKT